MKAGTQRTYLSRKKPGHESGFSFGVAMRDSPLVNEFLVERSVHADLLARQPDCLWDDPLQVEVRLLPADLRKVAARHGGPRRRTIIT